MIGSAQKAPVTNAALSALNLAVVRQVVFERAAEQIFEKSKRSTEAVVETAEETRQRNEAVTVVVEKNDAETEANNAKSSNDLVVATAPPDDPQPQRGGTVDINV